MVDIWADYAAGDDVLGDGSMGNPYKTLDTATTGINPNDHVKCVEGPANTALAGTFAWTDESASVVSSVDHSATGTGLLAVGDYIGKATAGPPGDAETYWEITVITGVNITIKAKYSGTTDGAAVTEKLGVIDVNMPINTGQKIMSPGTSGNPILISGGWNKTTGLQTGQTWWRDVAGGSSRGIDDNNQSYIRVEHIGLVKFMYNLLTWTVAVYGWELEHITCNGGTTGIYGWKIPNSEISHFCCSQNTQGFNTNTLCDNMHIHDGNIYSASGIILAGPGDGIIIEDVFIRPSSLGLQASNYLTNTTLRSINVKEYGSAAFDLATMSWTTMENISGYTSDTNSYFLGLARMYVLDVDGIVSEFVGSSSGQRHITDNGVECGRDINIVNISLTGGYTGIYAHGLHYGDATFSDVLMDTLVRGVDMDRIAQGVVLNKYRAVAVTTDVYFGSSDYMDQRSDLPYLKCQNFKADDEHRAYYGGEAGGIISRVQSNTTEADSGMCAEFTPKDGDWWMRQSFWTRGEKDTAKDMKLHIKQDAGSAFTTAGGIVEAAIYFEEKRITGWTPWVPTASYVEHTISAAALDVYEAGALELRVRVKGSAGNVYLDSFSAD